MAESRLDGGLLCTREKAGLNCKELNTKLLNVSLCNRKDSSFRTLDKKERKNQDNASTTLSNLFHSAPMVSLSLRPVPETISLQRLARRFVEPSRFLRFRIILFAKRYCSSLKCKLVLYRFVF